MPRAADTLFKIRSEILTDGAGIGYAGKTPSEQAILMNRLRQQSPRVFASIVISPQLVGAIIMKRGKWRSLTTAATTNETAFHLMELIKLSVPTEDFNTGQLRTYLDGLVTDAVLSAADRTAILSQTVVEVLASRSENLGLGEVLQGDVEQALL